MKVFDERNFEELLSLCREYKGYRGVIVVDTRAEASYVRQQLCEIHQMSPIPYLKEITGTLDNGVLVFETGSTIEICPPIEAHMMGKRYNTILVQSGIETMAHNARLEHCEFAFNGERAISNLREALLDASRNALRYGRRSDIQIDPMDITVDTSELDDFLNEFKVNQVS